MKIQKTFPKKLTTDEWNLLQLWSEYSKLDTWFDLRTTKDGKVDYVRDLEESRRLSLHRALKDFTEGIYIDKADWNVTKKQERTWNSLMDKFGYQSAKI
jgi:hypothetical protein